MGSKCSPPRVTCQLWFSEWSHSVVSDSLQPHGLYSPWNSPGQNTGVGSLSLFQEIFPTQGSNLLHFGQILYQLSHKGSPRIQDWVACLSPADLPNQESNQGLLHWRWILYQPSYQGNPFGPVPVTEFIVEKSWARYKTKELRVKLKWCASLLRCVKEREPLNIHHLFLTSFI